jgi:hypothetical protein
MAHRNDQRRLAMTETSAYWLARTIAALIGIIALLSWYFG